MPAEDAGSIYSEVRIRLDKLQNDITQAVSVMDRFGQKVVDTANIASNLFSNSYSKSIKQVETYVKSLDKAVADGAITQRQAISSAIEARKAEMAYIQATAARKGGYTDQEIGDLKRVKTQIEALTAEQKKFGDEIGKSSGNLKGLGLAVSTAILATFRAMTVETLAYSSALAGVRAATRGTSAELDQLANAAEASGKAVGTSSTQALGAIEALAKAGVSTADIMGGALPGALTLAAAGTMDVADAAEIAAATMTQFGRGGADVVHIADLLAAGAGKAQGEVSDLSQALKQAGLVASQTGLSVDDTVGSLAAFASAGLLGSDAGTSFRTMLLRLTPQSKEAAEKMKQLGLNAFDAKGEFIGITKFAGQLQTQLKGLTTEQRNAALATIFGSDSIRAANVLYTQGASGIEKWIDKVNDSGFAAETARIKLDSLAGDVQKLNAQASSSASKIGGSLTPVLRGLAQAATGTLEFFSKAPGWLAAGATAAAALGAGIGSVALGVGILTPLLAAMGITVSAAFGPIMLTVGALAALTGGVVAATAAVDDANRSRADKMFGDIGRSAGKSADDLKAFAKSASDAEAFIGVLSREGRTSNTDFERLAKDMKLTNDELAAITLRSDKASKAMKEVAKSYIDQVAQAKRVTDAAIGSGKAMDDYFSKKYPQSVKKAEDSTKPVVSVVRTLSEEIAYQNFLLASGAKDQEDALKEKISLREKEIARIEEEGAKTGTLSKAQIARIVELRKNNADNQADLDAIKKKLEDAKKAEELLGQAEKSRADEQRKNAAVILGLSKSEEDKILENRDTLLAANNLMVQSDASREANRVAIIQDAENKILKIKQDAQAKIDADEKKAREDALAAEKKAVAARFDLFRGLASALGELFTAIYDRQISDAQRAYDDEKERIENNGLTKKQVLEKGLSEANASGDAAAISDAQRALDLYNLETDFIKKRAKLEHEAAMAAWYIKVADATATVFQAALSAYSSTAAIPIVGPALAPGAALAAGAFAAPQLLGILAAVPPAPKFHTGGIFLGGPGGATEGPAILKRREMTLTEDQQAELFAMANGAGGGGSGGVTIPVTLVVDGVKMAQVVAKKFDDGVVKVKSLK